MGVNEVVFSQQAKNLLAAQKQVGSVGRKALMAGVDPQPGSCDYQALSAIEIALSTRSRSFCVPEDFISHRSSWRNALQLCIKHAADRHEDEDDKSYWEHELQRFDDAFGQLALIVEDSLQRPVVPYISAVGDAGNAYHDSFKTAHPLPVQWRWEELFKRMLDAAYSSDQQFEDADALIAYLDQLQDDGGHGGEKWTPAQHAIAGIRAGMKGDEAEILWPNRNKAEAFDALQELLDYSGSLNVITIDTDHTGEEYRVRRGPWGYLAAANNLSTVLIEAAKALPSDKEKGS